LKRLLVTIVMFVFTLHGWAYAADNPYSQGAIEGFLLQINTGASAISNLEIEDYSGLKYNFPLAGSAELLIDGIPVKLTDFRAGMEVYAKLQGRSIISLEGYSTEQLGYIAPGSKVRSGVVRKIDRDQLEIQLSTGKMGIYFTSPLTIVKRNGINTSLGNLYVGDRVRCYFDSLHSDMISQLNIEGDSVMIKGVYRASLRMVSRVENAIVLADIKVLRNGQWADFAPTLKVYYNKEVPVYMAGQPVSFLNLKNYVGKTVYAVTRDLWGEEQIEKMVLKYQYESNYDEQIKDINWYTNALELSNNKNLAFNDGTIIIKNGRLVDSSALNSRMDALVLADGRGGSAMANLIAIYNEDINNSNIGQGYIYAGRLDQIVEDAVWFKDFFILNENSWESFDDEKELYYDMDTGIYDVEQGKIITPQEFFSYDYAVDEDSRRVKDNNLHDWYGYAYTDGDRIVAIAVQKDMDSLLGQRISNGTITSIENDPLVGWTIAVRDSRDWSNRHERWMARTTDLRVNLSQALIIKGDRMILPEELKAGDRIYMVRDDFRGKVVLVK
jgi:hypothetical protein